MFIYDIPHDEIKQKVEERLKPEELKQVKESIKSNIDS
jgi:hypothetical protein